jgi:hypothetical protein
VQAVWLAYDPVTLRCVRRWAPHARHPLTPCTRAAWQRNTGSLPVTPKTEPKDNQLLAALPPAEWERWLPLLERVSMPLGQVVYESGRPLSHVVFPTSAIVSLLYVMENGASAEIAVVGHEGVVGISLFMGGGSTPSRGVV